MRHTHFRRASTFTRLLFGTEKALRVIDLCHGKSAHQGFVGDTSLDLHGSGSTSIVHVFQGSMFSCHVLVALGEALRYSAVQCSAAPHCNSGTYDCNDACVCGCAGNVAKGGRSNA